MLKNILTTILFSLFLFESTFVLSNWQEETISNISMDKWPRTMIYGNIMANGYLRIGYNDKQPKLLKDALQTNSGWEISDNSVPPAVVDNIEAIELDIHGYTHLIHLSTVKETGIISLIYGSNTNGTWKFETIVADLATLDVEYVDGAVLVIDQQGNPHSLISSSKTTDDSKINQMIYLHKKSNKWDTEVIRSFKYKMRLNIDKEKFSYTTSIVIDKEGYAHIVFFNVTDIIYYRLGYIFEKYSVGYATNKSGQWKIERVKNERKIRNSALTEPMIGINQKGTVFIVYARMNEDSSVIKYFHNAFKVWKESQVDKIANSDDVKVHGFLVKDDNKYIIYNVGDTLMYATKASAEKKWVKQDLGIHFEQTPKQSFGPGVGSDIWAGKLFMIDNANLPHIFYEDKILGTVLHGFLTD